MIPDQDGGRRASRLLRFFSAGIILDLHWRPLGQRDSVGQRWRRGRRRRGRAEPLVTTPPLPQPPLAPPALRGRLGIPCPLELGAGPGHCVPGSPIPGAPRPGPSLPRCGSGLRPPASPYALLPVRSCILSEVSTRSRSKLPAGKNVLLLGKCSLPRPAPPGPQRPGVPGPRASSLALFVRTADPAPPRLASRPVADGWERRGTRDP